MPIYLGPYNDPVDTNGTHHWDLFHAPDCRNSAIMVTRSGNTFNIDVAVANSDSVDSPASTITLYAAFRTRKFAHPSDVDTYISQSIFGASVPPVVSPSPWTNQTVPGRTSLGDNSWHPPTGTIMWAPSLNPPLNAIFVFVLTVQGVIPNNATQTSQVAVWVGP